MTYSARDFEHDTPPRIMGSETEYNIPNMTLEMDFRPHVSSAYYREDGRDIGDELWLENGARLYFETSGVTEYATPEVTSAQELLRYERAGEQTVQEIANGMAKATDSPSSDAFKRSGYDLPGRESLTAGHHENYATIIPDIIEPAARQAHPLHRALQSYLSTRGAWAGSGLVRKNNFDLTQKMDAISFNHIGKSSSEGSKPAYSIHPEAGLNRLEIRLGDGNMSDWAIMQKYAFTSLVLRMIEHGDFPHNLFLKKGNGERTLHDASKLMPVATDNSYIHPARHQRFIAEAALDFASQHPYVPAEETQAAQEIMVACHQIEELDRSLTGASALADRVDWAAKLTHMRDQGVETPTHADIRAVYYDLQWENIAARGIARKWYEKNSDSHVQNGEIGVAMLVPPATRAMARTAILAGLPVHPNSVQWHRIEAGANGYFKLDDPYKTA